MTVMPEMPISCSAVFTSSSLNGLMIASIFFIALPSQTRAAASARLAQSAGNVPRGGSLEDKAGFDQKAPLGAGLAGAEEEGRARCGAKQLGHRPFATYEVVSVLEGRGQRERHRRAARAVAEQVGRALGCAAGRGDILPTPGQVPNIV